MRISIFRDHFRGLILAIGVLAGVVCSLSGLAEQVDRALDPIRAAAWIRPPSGQIVVVDMDAQSVATIREWPWPRDHYATVVDALRRAGASSITFDVDFSSASTPAGDAAMAGALQRADGIVALPTFAQQARAGDTRSIDALPLPALRQHAALASVSMQPDADGIVRRAPMGTITDGLPRPSISSYIAHRSGSADTFFPIDFGIDPRRLPRISFTAVESGAFDPALVRGKDILIGATAVEMGDRYATPHWGVIPGVIIQALAAETLLRGPSAIGSSAVPLLLAAALAIALAFGAPRTAIAASIGAPILLFAASVWAQLALHIFYPLAAGLVLLVTVSLARGAAHLGERFERQRCFDEETGLPNRRAMVRDEGALAMPIAVAVIGNLDTVATLLGARAGHDLVLRLADRLKLASGRTVYRLSDRQLAFSLATPSDELPDYFAGLRHILTQPVEILGKPMDASVCIGVSDAEGAVQDKLGAAAHAAERAIAGRTFWQHSNVDMVALERELVLMGELDRAIGSGQIEVHYQPKLGLAENRITSVEALVRWRHPQRGMVGPDLFIPFAEESGRIGPLTLFVLERVVSDLVEWQQAGITVTAAVNLSAMLIAAPEFKAAVTRILESERVAPQSLIFEVTESAALADPERAAVHLREFRDSGVAISMDDYGTGQSTLTYLRQLPLSELKIDRSFVQHAHLNRSDGLMVRSTIDLAHDLGLKVVAEGIEEEECLAFLRDAKCDMVQGYLIARPMPSKDLREWLVRRALAA